MAAWFEPYGHLVEVEDLLQLEHPLIGVTAAQAFKERRHGVLPARIDLLAGRAIERSLETLGRLVIAEEEAVIAQEERIVVLPVAAQCLQHLGPHRPMSGLVFFEPVGLHLEHERHPLHQIPSSVTTGAGADGLARVQPSTAPVAARPSQA